MVDVNVTADVKTVGIPVSPTVEIEDRGRPQVEPVKDSSDSSGTALDDKALHSRQPAEKPLGEEELARVVADIEGHLSQMGNKMGLSLHKETNDVVVRITDRESGELIKQFPSDEILKLHQKLDELAGLLFDDIA